LGGQPGGVFVGLVLLGVVVRGDLLAGVVAHHPYDLAADDLDGLLARLALLGRLLLFLYDRRLLVAFFPPLARGFLLLPGLLVLVFVALAGLGGVILFAQLHPAAGASLCHRCLLARVSILPPRQTTQFGQGVQVDLPPRPLLASAELS